jgi:hypothetical protein
MPRAEIDLLLAWMDLNSSYYGTWDYTPHATCEAYLAAAEPLLAGMDRAGCVRCHPRKVGSDWVNLREPEASRLLRAPLARSPGGWGLATCRDRKAPPPRLRPVTQRIQPPDVFKILRDTAPDPAGVPVASFPDASAPGYRAMLAVIRKAREEALKAPRVDMPGAAVLPGRFRELPPLTPPAIGAATGDGVDTTAGR